MTEPNTPPTCREALRNIIEGRFNIEAYLPAYLVSPARASLAAPDRVADARSDRKAIHGYLDQFGDTFGSVEDRIRLLAQQRDEALEKLGGAIIDAAALRKIAEDCCNATGGGCSPGVSIEFLRNVPKEVAALKAQRDGAVEDLEADKETDEQCEADIEADRIAMQAKLAATEKERDEARRTLPADVREALQCAADYGPMVSDEWKIPEFRAMSNLCSAVLAKYPESATVPGQFDMLPKEHVADSLLSIAVQHEAERAAWIKERDELIAERDRFEAEAERHSRERRLAQDEMVKHLDESAKFFNESRHLRFMVAELLDQLLTRFGGAS
jgi:hypothetical protein